jgi:hypothetical protein
MTRLEKGFVEENQDFNREVPKEFVSIETRQLAATITSSRFRCPRATCRHALKWFCPRFQRGYSRMGETVS